MCSMLRTANSLKPLLGYDEEKHHMFTFFHVTLCDCTVKPQIMANTDDVSGMNFSTVFSLRFEPSRRK